MSGGEEVDSDGAYLKRSNTREEGRGLSIGQHEVDAMDVDHDEHRRTDHDRQGQPPDRSATGNQARDNDIAHTNAREPKAAPKGILELLHQDIGSAFLLCNSCKVSHLVHLPVS